MNNYNAMQYGIGCVLCYVLVSIIWGILFWRNYKSGHKAAFAGVLIGIGFMVQAFRNYYYFVIEHHIASEVVMYSNFIGAALFLSGSIMLLPPERN
jgi:hypothetical protein